MPFYEYLCQACGEHVEALQKMSEPPLVDCPACAKPELKKQVSAAGFRLKGAGWYETDFKDNKKRNLHGGSEATADGAKSESQGESKGDAKAESKVDSKPGSSEGSASQSSSDKSASATSSTDKAPSKKNSTDQAKSQPKRPTPDSGPKSTSS